MSTVHEITPAELRAEIDSGENLYLLDVREAHELEISVLPNVIHIPMGEVPDRMDEIPQDANIVVICRTGNRSGKITDYLVGNGFTKVRNMVAGMNGYAEQVDQTFQTY